MIRRPEIDGNYDNNDKYEVWVNMPGAEPEELHHERDLHRHMGTLSESNSVEPEMARVFISPDSAARRGRRQGENGKNNDEENESKKDEDNESKKDDEGLDESDGSRKMCVIEVDDDIPINDETEAEDAETKKIHTYAAKKTVAQGMMDIALITANANQLRYIIEFNSESPTFYVIVTLISFSLMLQVAVGMALIFKGRMDMKGKSKDPDAKRINNYVVVAIFLVTIVNVFIASFTITGNGRGNSGKTQ